MLDALTGAVGVPGAPVLALSGTADMLPVLRRRSRLASALAEYVRLLPYTPAELVALVDSRLGTHGFALAEDGVVALADEFAERPPNGAVFGAHRLADLMATRCEVREIGAEDLYAIGAATPPADPVPEPAVMRPEPGTAEPVPAGP